jgi:hypothetical protein
MTPLYRRILIGLGLVLVALIFILAGCGSEDEEVAEPTASPTGTPAPASQEDAISAQTNLPTELIEPDSPLEPPAQELATEIEEMTSPSPVPTPTAPSSGRGVAPAEASQALLEQALADLADRTGLAATAIRVVSVEEVEWSDTSLGCPEEGMMYAQVITPGYLIILEAEGQQYEYHADDEVTVTLCEK